MLVPCLAVYLVCCLLMILLLVLVPRSFLLSLLRHPFLLQVWTWAYFFSVCCLLYDAKDRGRIFRGQFQLGKITISSVQSALFSSQDFIRPTHFAPACLLKLNFYKELCYTWYVRYDTACSSTIVHTTATKQRKRHQSIKEIITTHSRCEVTLLILVY